MTRQPGSLRRKLLILAVAIAIFFLIAIAAGVAVFFSPLLTRYVEGDAFRIAMEEETAKGCIFLRPLRTNSTDRRVHSRE